MQPDGLDGSLGHAVTVWDRLVRIIALRFETETETFDRSLPGCSTRHAEWMPFPGEPMAMSREYARRVRADRLAEAVRAGISSARFREELNLVCRMSYEQQLEELAALLGRGEREGTGNSSPDFREKEPAESACQFPTERKTR